MKKLTVLFALVFALATQAQAKEVSCDGGIKLSFTTKHITVRGSDFGDKVEGTIAKNYKPRADHAGSVEYVLTVPDAEEGNVYAILDKGLVKSTKGRLTLEDDTDTDGGAPNFTTFECSEDQ